MPPKKRDRDSDEPKNGKVESIQADHEYFLQAFEKPTQIYRYLRTRNIIAPIFMHRNLTYMKQRMSRSNGPRESFKIDSLLSRISLKNNNQSNNTALLGDFMTLTFFGLFDKLNMADLPVSVSVEAIILKISHKKRKDSTSPLTQIPIGTCDVCVNPNSDETNKKVPAVSISTDLFQPTSQGLSRSYILVLHVQMSSSGNHLNGSDEPSLKRFKAAPKVFTSELLIFDKHNRCLLTDGDYELTLQEAAPIKPMSPKKQSTWEVIPDNNMDVYEIKFDEQFKKLPSIKFRLAWTKQASNGLVDYPGDLKSSVNPVNGRHDSHKTDDNVKSSLTISINGVSSNKTLSSGHHVENGKTLAITNGEPQIIYQFVYNNNSRQQTEAFSDYNCPWCSLNCMRLYSLLKHLKLCHARFTFTYVPSENSTTSRIDVAINDLYDGSYTGSPHDLIGLSGYGFSRAGPVRRTSVTNILVCRPRRQKPNLSEFMEVDEHDAHSQRPYISGHNRVYFHSVTCLPVHPKELDVDSEDESDPLWLQQKTSQMIDEFTDVNEGEKEFIKMWDLHLMKQGFVGDCQLPLACEMLLDLKGREILSKRLYKNFVIHLVNLFDNGILSPDNFYKMIQKLQRIMIENKDDSAILKEANEAQIEHWTTTGIHKHNEMLALQQKSDKELKQGPFVKMEKLKEKNALPQTSPNKKKPIPDIKPIKRSQSSIQLNGTVANKTRSAQIRDLSPRRRSASALQIPSTSSLSTSAQNRRKSVAIVSQLNGKKR